MADNQRHAQILGNQVIIMKALKLLLRAQKLDGFANELQLRINDIEAFLKSERSA